jgi:putative endonuclease
MRQSRSVWVYILASRKNGTLYVGVTTDLRTRIWQHRAGAVEGFTKLYRVTTLVYFEEFHGAREAIAREKELKGWTRKRKIEAIELVNPDWDDLAINWFRKGLDPAHGSG